MGATSSSWATIAFVVGGCNQVLGIAHTHLPVPDAAIDAVGCSGVQFFGLDPVPGFQGRQAFHPAQSASPLEMWYAQPSSTGAYDVYVATRASPSDPFGPGTAATFDSPTSDDDNATLTADGTHLMFVSSRAGLRFAYEVVRSGIGAPFGQPIPLGAFGGESLQALSLSLDGMIVFFTDTGNNMWSATRPALDKPFGPSVPLGTGITDLSVSPDQLEVFYTATGSPQNIVRRIRGSTSAKFDSSEQPVLPNALDPAISTDSATLTVVVGLGELYTTHRTCP